jgi:hypothetical protein
VTTPLRMVAYTLSRSPLIPVTINPARDNIRRLCRPSGAWDIKSAYPGFRSSALPRCSTPGYILPAPPGLRKGQALARGVARPTGDASSTCGGRGRPPHGGCPPPGMQAPLAAGEDARPARPPHRGMYRFHSRRAGMPAPPGEEGCRVARVVAPGPGMATLGVPLGRGPPGGGGSSFDFDPDRHWGRRMWRISTWFEFVFNAWAGRTGHSTGFK